MLWNRKQSSITFKLNTNNIFNFVLFLFVLLIFSTTIGCEKNYSLLNEDNSKLHQSMKNYYELDSESFKGESFEAKLVDIVSIPLVDSVRAIEYYRYRIVIAPIYNKPIQIKSVYLGPTNPEIKKYLDKESPVGTGNLTIWNSLTDHLDFDTWVDVDDYIAYELSITFNNLTKEFMEKKEISTSSFIQSMKNLSLIIEYNDSREEIHMEELIITEFDSIDISKRIDIQQIMKDGQTFGRFAPFTSGY